MPLSTIKGFFDDTTDENGKIINPKAHGEILDILGNEYKAWRYDFYIYDALAVAERIYLIEPEKVDYKLISTLRDWIRENYQHNHNFRYKQIKDYAGYKRFINKVIEAEYRYCDEEQKKVAFERLKIK